MLKCPESPYEGVFKSRQELYDTLQEVANIFEIWEAEGTLSETESALMQKVNAALAKAATGYEVRRVRRAE